MLILELGTITSAAAEALLFYCHLNSGTSFGNSTKPCGRLMCLLKAAESSPATLVASQLLPPRQLTPSSTLRQNHTEETVEFIKAYTLMNCLK